MNPKGYAPAGLIAAVVAVSSLALGSLISLPVETSPPPSLVAAAAISTGQYMDHIRFLADPAMKGRGNGSVELERAAEYLAAQFRVWGLRPAGEDGSYFQTFELITDTEIGDEGRLTLGGEALEPDDDFSAFRFSAASAVTGPLVFVGYGITAP